MGLKLVVVYLKIKEIVSLPVTEIISHNDFLTMKQNIRQI